MADSIATVLSDEERILAIRVARGKRCAPLSKSTDTPEGRSASARDRKLAEPDDERRVKIYVASWYVSPLYARAL